MADSQPGKVQAFDPSVTLSDFAAENRDRFMFNENQLVLAKLQQPRPVEASAVNRGTDGELTVFAEYKNLDGEFVYFDGSFQALSTPGVPTLPVHRIVVGFDRQITTDSIKFWSTGFVDTALVYIEWSFDDVTWFDAGDITWVQEFDDTIEVFPGDNPPTGQFVYTGTFDAGVITGRYWRIRSDAEETVISFANDDVTVGDASHFPDFGDLQAFTSGGSLIGAGSYLSTTATKLNDVSGVVPVVNGTVASTDYAFGDGVTEVQVIPTLDPILEHWNSDGTKAVTNAVEGGEYYDMAYDKIDDVYYALRFNTELELADGIDADDDFNTVFVGNAFDPVRWIESPDASYFIHNTVSGTLDMTSAGGPGQLAGNYGLDGNYHATIELVDIAELGEGAFFGLEAKDYDSGNQYALSVVRGLYNPPTSVSGIALGAGVDYFDTIGTAAEIQDFRILPETFDFSYPGDVVYEITYLAASGTYKVVASGIEWPQAIPGVPYTAIDSARFTVSNINIPADGQKFEVTVRAAEADLLSTTNSGIELRLERFGTNSYCRYSPDYTPGYFTSLTGNIPSDARVRPQIYGDPNGQDVYLIADNYTASGTYGGSIFFDTPVFSVVTVNKSGELEQVSGISDVDGYAIKSFDIIRDPQATYNSFLTPRVGIAVNGVSAGSGGELYIKVNDTIYKYAKNTLPLANEAGSAAAITTTGEIPSTGITNFAHNGYGIGGLSYIQYISDLDGVFVKSIATTTMTAIDEKALLDVDSINLPFGWNVSDLATLYFVDTGSTLKLYDLNETKAAFVNVTSDKQILSAGTQETATVIAQVLNVYGEPKSNKTMTFTVSAGDGAISPAVGCSDINGEDITVYTVGSAVGTATITVTVSDLTC